MCTPSVSGWRRPTAAGTGPADRGSRPGRGRSPTCKRSIPPPARTASRYRDVNRRAKQRQHDQLQRQEAQQPVHHLSHKNARGRGDHARGNAPRLRDDRRAGHRVGRHPRAPGSCAATGDAPVRLRPQARSRCRRRRPSRVIVGMGSRSGGPANGCRLGRRARKYCDRLD